MERTFEACGIRGHGRASGLVLALAIAAAGNGAASCLPTWSLNDLATPADTVVDERMAGHWVSMDFDSVKDLEVKRAELEATGGARLTMGWREKRKKPWNYTYWNFRLVRLGPHWFADFPPQPPAPGKLPPSDPLDSWHMRFYHLILRVDLESDTLTFSELDDLKLGLYADSHPHEPGLKRTHATDGFTVVLTDSTSKLRQLFRDIADVDSLFEFRTSLVRAR